MKKIAKFFLISMLILIAFIGVNNIKYSYVYGNTNTDPIQSASEWWSAENGEQLTVNGDLFRSLTNIINIAGTAIISIVAVALGIKYMIGSAADKSDVKEQLITFLIACLFFFGWSSISGLLITGTTYDPSTGTYSGISGATQLFIFQGLNGENSLKVVFARIFSIVVFFGKIIALIATMYIGVKYIFSGADVRAELKERGPRYIIGILLIFCTLNVLTFISNAINETLAK